MHSQSSIAVKRVLSMYSFMQLPRSEQGRFGYFIKDDIKVVQVDQREELTDSQLEEIADQAGIQNETFLKLVHLLITIG